MARARLASTDSRSFLFLCCEGPLCSRPSCLACPSSPAVQVATLRTLDSLFNTAFKYPIIIFYPHNMGFQSDGLLRATASQLLFVPMRVNGTTADCECPAKDGGCPPLARRTAWHFLSHDFFAAPTLQVYEYVWLMSPYLGLSRVVTEDPFVRMRRTHTVLGYHEVTGSCLIYCCARG